MLHNPVFPVYAVVIKQAKGRKRQAVTALKKYERLESLGLWRESETTQRREVIVSFGAASLVLSDSNSKPLAHWSLAAVRTLNPGETPTIYKPDHSTGETLEIDEAEMIDAIAEVRRSIRRIGPHPGRLRWALTGAMILIVAALTMFWLPSISADYATRVTPAAKVQQIGQTIMLQTNRLTGQPCGAIEGRRAMTRLENWLLPDGGTIHIVDMGARFSAHLPGGNILLNRVLIEEESGPEVAAGFVLMEKTLMQENNPITNLFHALGTRATLTFIANGTLSEKALAAYARTQLTHPLHRPEDAPFLNNFETAKLTSSPFAFALDASGKATSTLIALDPVRDNYRPQITDADWIALQSICGEG